MYLKVSVYSVSHFFVDFACALFMFGALRSTSEWVLCLLLYNFFAFAMQMPLGVLADRMNRNALFASAGCLLVAFAYVFSGIPLLGCTILGLGNGMFHVGGGIEVMNEAQGKCAPLGIFVSPGALGLYIGTLLGKSSGLPLWLGALTMLLCSLFLVFSTLLHRHSLRSDNPAFSPGTPSRGVWLAAVCLFAVVCLRSLMGMTADFPGKAAAGVLSVLAVVLGKALGGILSDRFGALATSAVSLLLCAVLFLFPGFTLGYLLALLLFNMTMPITLNGMAKLFPQARGFAFGALTFALFLGFLPVFLANGSFYLAPVLLCAGSLVSLVLLSAGLWGQRT